MELCFSTMASHFQEEKNAEWQYAIACPGTLVQDVRLFRMRAYGTTMRPLALQGAFCD